MNPRFPAICLLLSLCSQIAFAHPGGLNSEGCHTNRKTGDYHCHRSTGSAPAPRPQSESQLQPPTSTGKGTETSTWTYRNCTEARAAGAAPVRRGEPGYGPHLDRDNDGIGCEPYR